MCTNIANSWDAGAIHQRGFCIILFKSIQISADFDVPVCFLSCDTVFGLHTA